MKDDLISVIIPCYNSEKYIEACIDSILNQTYPYLEIIIIEDCSTDKTREKLKKYEKFDNVKIIYNKENHGLSYNRNIGMEHSTGKFIGFIDSDDYVDKTYYSTMIKAIKKNNSDVCVCDIMTVYSDTGERIINKAYDTTKDGLGYINTGLSASSCNKLFKREIILKNKFAVGKVNEDLAVILPILANTNKIAYAEGIYYYYIQHESSIQNSSFSDKRFDIIDGVDLTLQRIKNCKNYDKIKDAIIFNQIIVLLIYVIPKEKNIFKRTTFIRKFSKLTKKYKIRRNIYFWNFLEKCSIKHKIYYKALFKLTCNHLNFCASLLILFYDIILSLKKIKNKSVIKNCNDKQIIRYAINQSKMKSSNIKISVVVPNYNYSKFLCERLCSILNQKIKLHEIIILDDKSTDNSTEIIDKYKNMIKDYVNIKTVYNKENSGTPFKQWKKGFDLATGDYVWIAEADDYCNENLLKELVKPIIKGKKNIMISYADTAFINRDGEIILKTIKPEIDIQKTGHWNNSYINDGINEIKKFSFLNNTIANVSSCLIKNNDYEEYLNEACKYRQAGDWIFYVYVMSMGNISFSNKIYNYYRVHGNNVSSTMNQKKHINEIKSIYKTINKKFNIDKKNKKLQSDRIDYLAKCWKVDK